MWNRWCLWYSYIGVLHGQASQVYMKWCLQSNLLLKSDLFPSETGYLLGKKCWAEVDFIHWELGSETCLYDIFVGE